MNTGMDTRARTRPACIVEIVGPAGAGKTTISNALAGCAPAVQRGLSLRQWRFLPRYVVSGVSLLPILRDAAQHGRRFTRQQLMTMIYLQVQLWAMQHADERCKRVIVLDQGPVYKLAEICDFSLENRGQPGLDRWWHAMMAQWAAQLSLIIVLDAADEVLMERIGTRDKWHVVKAAPAAEASAYLARYRAAIQGIVREMADCATDGGPRLLHVRTDQAAVEAIVHQILPVVDLQAGYSGLPVHR